MKTVNVSDLIGPALDWAVATIKEYSPELRRPHIFTTQGFYGYFSPSTDWAQGGPIIERAGINVLLRYGSLPPNHVQDTWDALIKPEFYTLGRPESGVKKEVMHSGPTPLIAAMRCYVASKLGDTVEIPSELV